MDETSQQIGIRTIRYTVKDGFFINGEKLYLRGANRHQAFPHVGDAAANSMQERDVIGLKRGGYNAVRAAHYPSDPAFLDACDRYGLLVVECIPGWQFYTIKMRASVSSSINACSSNCTASFFFPSLLK